ncbi:MAG: response regulator, partial [Acidimicrobiales bacterium]
LNMPEIDGMELGRRIAADPVMAATRLVLLTSSAQRGEAADAHRSGFAGYLTKPVRQSHLLDTLATVMGGAESDAPAPLVTRHLLPEPERPRILVAEDNEVSQKVAAGMLQRIGYRVDVVPNGEEAVAAVARGAYAAVLMDCQMPVMDGYEATRLIRSTEAGASRIPIIAVSASAMADDADAAVATGMDEYLTKPIAFDDLERALARWAPVTVGTPPSQPPSMAPVVATPLSAVGGPEEPALDPAKMSELEAIGGSDFVGKIMRLFLTAAPERMEALCSALDAGDADATSRAAHVLRGSAANIGARPLSDACATAEEAARAGDLESAAQAVEQAARQLERVMAAGKAFSG